MLMHSRNLRLERVESNAVLTMGLSEKRTWSEELRDDVTDGEVSEKKRMLSAKNHSSNFRFSVSSRGS
jgi:hypothetical protein